MASHFKIVGIFLPHKTLQVKSGIHGDAALTFKFLELDTDEFKNKVGYFEPTIGWKYLPQRPSLVYFFTEHCPQCERVKPHLEETAQKWQDKILFFKLNTDSNPEIVRNFRIRSIPAFLFLAVGKPPLITFGFMSQEELSLAIQEKLNVAGPTP